MPPSERAPGGSGTVDIAADPHAGGTAGWWRRLILTLLAAIVVFGSLGGFGVRSMVVRVGDAGVDMTVRYPRVARAGLSVPFEIRIVKRDRFDGDVVLEVSQNYLDLFDRNAI